ncbi:MAG: zf-HC2 domain-containing protein [Gammaproteobacteria bacterium]|nr:zf-HC2 domain-containing protein [Gammaproteobacteria bacterium]
MLSCKEVTEHADEYLAQELPLSRRIGVGLHLMMCKHCRRYVKQLRWLIGAFGELPRQASDEEVSEVMSRVKGRKPPAA